MKYILFVLLCVHTLLHYSESKREITLSDRVQQLSDLAGKTPIVRLNNEKYKLFVKNTPRNYSIIVMFTALSPNRQCGICQPAYDEFNFLASSWRYSATYSNRLFFAMVDFDEAKEVFQQLNLNSAPEFIHFPSKGKPKRVDKLDIQRYGFAAESLARWVAEITDITIRFTRPPNYSGLLAIVVLLTLVIGLLYLKKNNLDFIYNNTMWAYAALAFTFTMISGQMWNNIRGPPFVTKTQYIYPASQAQYIGETYIIGVLYALVVLGMVLMTEAAGKRKRAQAIIGLGLVAVMFSILLSIFRMKAHGYPFSFLFK